MTTDQQQLKEEVASYGAMTPLKGQESAWVQHPDAVAEVEAYALLASVEELKKTVDWAKSLVDVEYIAKARHEQYLGYLRDEASKIRSELNVRIGVYVQEASGVGVYVQEASGVGVYAQEASGVGVYVQEASGIGAYDQEAFGMGGFGSRIRDAFRRFERAFIRPALDPVKETAQKIERYTLRPALDPIKRPLYKFEKYVLRPAGENAKKGIVLMDQTLPGWTLLLDFVVPIPIGLLLRGVVGSISQAVNQLTMAGTLVKIAPSGFALKEVGMATTTLVNSASIAARAVTMPMTQGAVNIVGSAGVQWLAQYPLFISKGTMTFLETKGSLQDKIIATTIEAINGFQLVLMVASALLPVVSPALIAIGLILDALRAGITVLTAWQASRALKKRMKVLDAEVRQILERIAAEERRQIAEIEALRRKIVEIRVLRERLAAARALRRQQMEEQQRANDPLAVVATSLGITEMQFVVGGLAVVGTGVLVVLISE